MSENYLQQMYSGFADSQNEKVKQAIVDEKGNSYKMSKGNIGNQGKNEILDPRVLIQQIQNLGKKPSQAKIKLGKTGILNGAYKSLSYAELWKQNVIVSLNLGEFSRLQRDHNSVAKFVEYKFASRASGLFFVTTSYDKDFVVDLFQIHLEDVVKLKNAMTRTWKPDGSNTTFNVANLFDVLEKLTMQQLLLSYQPAS